VPQGSSAINFLRMLGGAAGVSLCGIVLERASPPTGTRCKRGDQRSPARGLQRSLDAGRAVRPALVVAWHLRHDPTTAPRGPE
jgi:hypothetical protein